MEQLKSYLLELTGEQWRIEPKPQKDLGRLPMYISSAYKLYDAQLFSQDFILVSYRNAENFSIAQLTNHFKTISEAFNKKVVLVIDDLEAFNRNRLIKNGIGFIIPNKQLHLPNLYVSLKESFKPKYKSSQNKLLPSAQVILLYHILKHNEKIEELSFKMLAEKLHYTQMAITKAVEDLKQFDLISVEGSKEKYIRFRYENRHALWNEALKFMVNPVLKKMYADEKPNKPFLYYSNESALPEYSDMNPSRQSYYAIEKTQFYALQKNETLKNLNEYEGKYCLEVWKYNPDILAGAYNDRAVVDPLSLYLSLKESHDERIDMALEQIIEKIVW